ncbi:CAP-Gly domain-containing linker protein 2 [Chytriomyces hyalinus]|nr:CAP-Gly domain-containing linker protein 2 [Chytriomyces hyalinus]
MSDTDQPRLSHSRETLLKATTSAKSSKATTRVASKPGSRIQSPPKSAESVKAASASKVTSRPLSERGSVKDGSGANKSRVQSTSHLAHEISAEHFSENGSTSQSVKPSKQGSAVHSTRVSKAGSRVEIAGKSPSKLASGVSTRVVSKTVSKSDSVYHAAEIFDCIQPEEASISAIEASTNPEKETDVPTEEEPNPPLTEPQEADASLTDDSTATADDSDMNRQSIMQSLRASVRNLLSHSNRGSKHSVVHTSSVHLLSKSHPVLTNGAEPQSPKGETTGAQEYEEDFNEETGEGEPEELKSKSPLAVPASAKGSKAGTGITGSMRNSQPTSATSSKMVSSPKLGHERDNVKSNDASRGPSSAAKSVPPIPAETTFSHPSSAHSKSHPDQTNAEDKVKSAKSTRSSHANKSALGSKANMLSSKAGSSSHVNQSHKASALNMVSSMSSHSSKSNVLATSGQSSSAVMVVSSQQSKAEMWIKSGQTSLHASQANMTANGSKAGSKRVSKHPSKVVSKVTSQTKVTSKSPSNTWNDFDAMDAKEASRPSSKIGSGTHTKTSTNSPLSAGKLPKSAGKSPQNEILENEGGGVVPEAVGTGTDEVDLNFYDDWEKPDAVEQVIDSTFTEPEGDAVPVPYENLKALDTDASATTHDKKDSKPEEAGYDTDDAIETELVPEPAHSVKPEISKHNAFEEPTEGRGRAKSNTNYVSLITSLRKEIALLRQEIGIRDDKGDGAKEREMLRHIEAAKSSGNTDALHKDTRICLDRQKKAYQILVAQLRMEIRRLKFQRNSTHDPLIEGKYFPYLPRTPFSTTARQPQIGIIGNLPLKASDYFALNPPPPTGNHMDSGNRWWWGSGPNLGGNMPQAYPEPTKASTPSRVHKLPPVTPSSNPKSAPAEVQAGDRVCVMINGGRVLGMVKYVGIFDPYPDIGFWCGIKLDRPLGTHDGIVRGKRYFKCEENHGLFVKMDKIVSVMHTHGKRFPTVPHGALLI